MRQEKIMKSGFNKALERQSRYTFYSQTCAYFSFAFLLLLVVVQDVQINTFRKNLPPQLQ
jgi:hypothetical protein